MSELLRCPFAAVPDGWKLVPIEPTSEMVQAIQEETGAPHLNWAVDAYKRMLAAAPAQPGERKFDPDALAQFIRSVDGDHTLGAGELAEKICEWLQRAQLGEEKNSNE